MRSQEGIIQGQSREKYDEQVAFRHADASGGHIIENRHEKKRKRDIQVNERGSEATNEEQTDEGRKMVRFEQEAPNTSASPDPYVAVEHLVRDETPSRPGSVHVQKSFEHISALDVFYEKDERENRCIGEVQCEQLGTCLFVEQKCWGGIEDKMLEISREVNWMYSLRIGHVSTPSRGKRKSNQKIAMDEELVQEIVMDEELVQYGVMDGKFVKVVLDLSIFKIGGWNILQPSNQKLLEEWINENNPRLLIGIPSRDSFFTKESRWQSRLSTLLCEDLHEIMQCHERQHFVASNDLHEHPKRHSSWSSPTRAQEWPGTWPVSHAEEPTEEIDEAGIRNVACKCGTGGD